MMTDIDIGKKVRERVAAEEANQGSETDRQAPDIKFIEQCFFAEELGDGILYRFIHQGQKIYDVAKNEWFVFKGHYWHPDESNEAKAGVEKVAEAYFFLIENIDQKIKELQTEDDREETIKRLKKKKTEIYKRVSALRKVRRIKSVLEAATFCEDPLVIHSREFDNKPYLTACKNGVIDNRLGSLRPGRPEDYLSKACPTEFHGVDAPCERWGKFVSEIMGDDPDKVEYLQRLLGYSLLGGVYEHVFIICVGPGRNGKTTLFEALMRVLGPLASPIRPEMLLDSYQIQNSSGPTPDRMALKGLRVAVAEETKDGVKLSSSQVKALTGGGYLTGRNPHDKYETTFKQSHTLFLCSNYPPDLDGNDQALRARIQQIPFTTKFVKHPKEPNERPIDPFLMEKLMEEAPGILGWLVEGCLKWQLEGLDAPSSVRETTENYLDDEDLYFKFVQECLDQDDELKIQANRLYDGFASWWKRNVSNFVPKQQRFGRRMRQFFKCDRSTGGVYWYYGVELNDAWQQPE